MKVLVALHIPQTGIELLKNEGLDVTVWTDPLPMGHDQFMEAVKKHDILLSTSNYKLDAAFLTANRHLKLISQFAAGYNNIDTDKAKELNIPVANTPNAMSHATADIAFGLLLAVSRKMFYMHRQILSDDWGPFQPRAHLGIELKGKTLGVFGLGRIGTEFARRCVGAYEMRLLYHNRHRTRRQCNSNG